MFIVSAMERIILVPKNVLKRHVDPAKVVPESDCIRFWLLPDSTPIIDVVV